MSDDRRTVRTTQQFFEDLDRQLPSERGPNGEPSAHDFQVYELLRVVEEFAVGFDAMTELIPGRPGYRILVSAGPCARGSPSSVSSLPMALSNSSASASIPTPIGRRPPDPPHPPAPGRSQTRTSATVDQP